MVQPKTNRFLVESLIGASLGVAGLGVDAKVPAAQLPLAAANGAASLDADGKLPDAQTPAAAARKADAPLNVRDFGAKGDGATNDTAAITAALAAGGTQKRAVFVPDGVYMVNGTLNVPADVDFYSIKGTIKLSADPGAFVIDVIGSRASVRGFTVIDNGHNAIPIHAGIAGAAKISDVVIENNRVVCTATLNAGIYATGVDRLRVAYNYVENLTVTEASTLAKGILFHCDYAGSGVTYDTSIIGNTVRGFWRGIDSYGTASRLRVRIEGNSVDGSLHEGIYAYHAPRSIVANNDVSNCLIGGIWSDSGTDPESLTDAAPGNRVIGNRISRCGSGASGYGILTEEVYGGVIANNTITEPGADGIRIGGGTRDTVVSGNTVIGAVLDGIVLDKSRNPNTFFVAEIVVSGNIVKLGQRHGINVIGAQRTTQIIGNTVTDNGLSAAATFAGIHIDKDASASRVVVIQGNVIGNSLPSGAGTGPAGLQAYGVRVPQNNAVEEVSVIGNYFRGHSTANVSANYVGMNLLGNVFYDGTVAIGGTNTKRYSGNTGANLSGVVAGGVNAITHAGTTLIIPGPSTSAVQVITLNANITQLTMSGEQGQHMTLIFVQDATGGRTVGFSAPFKLAGAWPTGQAAGSRATLKVVYDGTNWIELSRSVVP